MSYRVLSCASSISIHDTASRESPHQPVASWSPHTAYISAARFNHNNQLVGSVGEDGNIVLSTCHGRVLCILGGSASTGYALHDLDFSSSSRWLCAAGEDRIVRIWDLKRKQIDGQFNQHKEAVVSVAFGGDDTFVVSGDSAGVILVHNLVQNKTVGSLHSPDDQSIKSIRCSRLSKSLMAASLDDGSVCVWDAKLRKLIASFRRVHASPASAIAFSPTNKAFMASAGLDKRVLFFDLSAKAQLPSEIRCSTHLTGVDFSADGLKVCLSDLNGNIMVHDLRKADLPEIEIVAHRNHPIATVVFENPFVGDVESFKKTIDFLASGEEAFVATSELGELRTGTSGHGMADLFSPVQQRNRLKVSDKDSETQRATRELDLSMASNDASFANIHANLSPARSIATPLKSFNRTPTVNSKRSTRGFDRSNLIGSLSPIPMESDSISVAVQDAGIMDSLPSTEIQREKMDEKTFSQSSIEQTNISPSPNVVPLAGLSGGALEELKCMISDFRDSIQDDLLNLHVDLIRQFHEQETSFTAKFKALEAEVQHLRLKLHGKADPERE